MVLSAAEREQLSAIAADRNQPRRHVERARIVLASADWGSAQRAAHSIGVSRPAVWRWQQRFAESGVGGLLRDKTRKPGKAPIAAETTARVAVPRFREGMCGWPPGRKKKLRWVCAKSLAVMCPAFVVRWHDRRPRWEP